MREVPVETIPEDILKCDEVHGGGTTLFVFQSVLLSCRGGPSVCQLEALSPKMTFLFTNRDRDVMLVKISAEICFLIKATMTGCDVYIEKHLQCLISIPLICF